mmetsp:Transcript_13790/g.22500  ORF Transcript_13790/g.22500 Transcript_13790/m.22500 type:complete len:369 (-) Transcript_13790:768-1874(-)
MSSQAAIQISRGALLALSAGAGSLYMYSTGQMPNGAKDLGMYAMQLNAKRAADGGYMIQNGHPNAGGGNDDVPEYLIPLTEQLNSLSGEVARLRIQNQYAGGGYAVAQPFGFSWTTIITIGGVGVLVLYVKGYSFADFMYVTKKALSAAVEALEQSIETLGIALENVKRELSYKMGLIEDKIDDTRVSLEEKITSEVGDVKRELENVGQDVKGISFVQDRVQGMVEGIETQIDSIENRIENANDQLLTANKGIYLLCNVVAEQMNSGKSKGNNRHGSSSLYEELVSYTRRAMSRFSSSVREEGDMQSNNTVANGPAVNSGGLKMLITGDDDSAVAPSPPVVGVPSFHESMFGASGSSRSLGSNNNTFS